MLRQPQPSATGRGEGLLKGRERLGAAATDDKPPWMDPVLALPWIIVREAHQPVGAEPARPFCGMPPPLCTFQSAPRQRPKRMRRVGQNSGRAILTCYSERTTVGSEVPVCGQDSPRLREVPGGSSAGAAPASAAGEAANILHPNFRSGRMVRTGRSVRTRKAIEAARRTFLRATLARAPGTNFSCKGRNLAGRLELGPAPHSLRVCTSERFTRSTFWIWGGAGAPRHLSSLREYCGDGARWPRGKPLTSPCLAFPRSTWRVLRSPPSARARPVSPAGVAAAFRGCSSVPIFRAKRM